MQDKASIYRSIYERGRQDGIAAERLRHKYAKDPAINANDDLNELISNQPYQGLKIEEEGQDFYLNESIKDSIAHLKILLHSLRITLSDQKLLIRYNQPLIHFVFKLSKEDQFELSDLKEMLDEVLDNENCINENSFDQVDYLYWHRIYRY